MDTRQAHKVVVHALRFLLLPKPPLQPAAVHLELLGAVHEHPTVRIKRLNLKRRGITLARRHRPIPAGSLTTILGGSLPSELPSPYRGQLVEVKKYTRVPSPRI